VHLAVSKTVILTLISGFKQNTWTEIITGSKIRNWWHIAKILSVCKIRSR